MLMRWPGHVVSGTVDDRLAANIDIAPTVLDAVGLAPSPLMDGRSLLNERAYIPRTLLTSLTTDNVSYTLVILPGQKRRQKRSGPSPTPLHEPAVALP